MGKFVSAEQSKINPDRTKSQFKDISIIKLEIHINVLQSVTHYYYKCYRFLHPLEDSFRRNDKDRIAEFRNGRQLLIRTK